MGVDWTEGGLHGLGYMEYGFGGALPVGWLGGGLGREWFGSGGLCGRGYEPFAWWWGAG